MTPVCSATIFHISNLETAVKYYTEVLGFTLDFRYEQIAGVKYGSVFIHLSAPNPGVTKKAIGEGHMYIFCDEVDQYCQEIIDKGALLFITVDNRTYGMRDFGVKDHDGNILAFGTGIDK
jgi:uncharacterized glyoxalase superfamily protein PhnB